MTWRVSYLVPVGLYNVPSPAVKLKERMLKIDTLKKKYGVLCGRMQGADDNAGRLLPLHMRGEHKFERDAHNNTYARS